MCGTPGNGTVSYPHTFTADPATSQNHYTLPNDKTATATVKFTKPSGGGTGGGGGGSSIPTATVDKTVTNGSAGVKAENGKNYANSVSVSAGKTVIVSTTPAANYMTEGVTVTYGSGNNKKTVPVAKNSDGTYSFTMPSSSVTVTPVFVPDPNADPENDPSTAQDTIRNYSKDFEKCDDTHYENCPINQYPDASATAWYHDGVHFCIENGIMRGYDDGHFYPTKETTRAQLVQVLYNIAGQPNVTSDKSYSDVNAGDWFYKAVQWATKNDIVSGYNDGKFRPNDPITREQVARVLMGYAKFLGYDTSATSDLKGYTDTNTVSNWATEYVQWAVGAGVYCGPMGSQNLLAANGNTVRSELATMMMNFCTKLAK